MAEEKKEREGYQFGTFKGVFTPSILTILGVIMYLRFGWVLGNVGLFQTVVIVLLSVLITFLTGLSLSALATNMKVGGGGAYYIISRSLGLEPGAAVGIPLFFAQALGISFYIAGFAESVTVLFPFLHYQIIAVLTLIVLAVVTITSANLALKLQYVILATIVASLVSFFMGEPTAAQTQGPISQLIEKESFWTVFAVFFPAVTGIEAGLAMSGDLKRPEKSLPLGTLLAIGVSLIVYLAIPIFISSKGIADAELIENPFIMKDLAKWGFLVVLGVWGSTLSSAMGAFLGAPRTLKALSHDKVVPRFLGIGFGEGKDPRYAAFFSFLIALAGILGGGLNFIAPVLTMFFLTSYGLLNLSAALEGMISSPSFRPKFKVPWGYSLAGAFGCFATMFMIDPGATFTALFFSGLVYFMMKRRRINAHWGDMRYGILLLLLHFVIYRLEEKKPDLKTWRPNILLLSGPPKTRWHLIEIADTIASLRGFLTVNTILSEQAGSTERIDSLKSSIRSYLKEKQIRALVNVHVAENMLEGMKEVIKTYGFGPITPNTVFLGDTENKEMFLGYAEVIRQVHKQRRNLMIMRIGQKEFETEKDEIRIDVLWGGIKQNAGLMLAIAYLIKKSPKWNKSTLRMKTIVNDPSESQEAEERLKSFIKEQRLEAEPSVIVREKKDLFETLAENTKEADLVFIGMRAPQEEESPEEYTEYYQQLLEKTANFPPTIMVLASENIEFHRFFDSE